MQTEMLLYIAFIFYILIMLLAFLFKIQWLFMIAGLIWFIPIIEIDNTFLQVISVSMILFHAVLGFGIGRKGDDFE